MASVLALLARRHLRAHTPRAFLTAAAVACGVALVVAIETVNAAALGAFREAVEDLAGRAALQVFGRSAVPDDLVDRLRTVPGVAHAVPVVTATFFATSPPVAGEALAVFAADITDGHAIETLGLLDHGVRVVEDPLSFLVDPASVVITRAFARRSGLRLGDPLPVRTPVGPKVLTVRGILPAGGIGRAYGGNLILMDVLGAQALLGREGRVDHVDLVVDPHASADEVARRIRLDLPEGIEVAPPARRGERIDRYLRSYRNLLSGVSGLALLAAVFVAGSATATAVAARRREIGLLRCIGVTRRTVHRLVLTEALLTAVLGIAAGIPIGIGLAALLIDLVRDSASLVFSLASFRSAFSLPPAAAALGATAGLVAALVAAWLPARGATAVSPLAATHREALRPDPRRRRPALRPLVVIALPTALAVVLQLRSDLPWVGNAGALLLDVFLIGLFAYAAPTVGRAVRGALRPFATGAARLALERLAVLPPPLALSAGVLALGLGLMLMSGSLVRSFERSVLDFVRRQVRADLVVAAPTATGWLESPLPGELADALARLEGVARVERLRLAEHDHRGTRISIDSLETSAFAPERADDFTFVHGEPRRALAAVAAGEAVLVSSNFARQQRVRLGDVLTFDTPAGRLALPVAGVVVDHVSPRGSVIMTRPLYRQWWRDEAANRFHLTLEPSADSEAVRRAIVTGPGAAVGGVVVRTQRELVAYHRTAVRRAFRFTIAVETLPLVVATLGLADALLAVGLDRRRELGLLRAAGMSRGQLFRTVIGESIGVAFLGLVGGVAMGVALAVYWVRVNFRTQLGWDLDLHLALGALPVAAVLALACGLLAGALPAHRFARLPAVTVLRDG